MSFGTFFGASEHRSRLPEASSWLSTIDWDVALKLGLQPPFRRVTSWPSGRPGNFVRWHFSRHFLGEAPELSHMITYYHNSSTRVSKNPGLTWHPALRMRLTHLTHDWPLFCRPSMTRKCCSPRLRCRDSRREGKLAEPHCDHRGKTVWKLWKLGKSALPKVSKSWRSLSWRNHDFAPCISVSIYFKAVIFRAGRSQSTAKYHDHLAVHGCSWPSFECEANIKVWCSWFYPHHCPQNRVFKKGIQKECHICSRFWVPPPPTHGHGTLVIVALWGGVVWGR